MNWQVKSLTYTYNYWKYDLYDTSIANFTAYGRQERQEDKQLQQQLQQ